MDAHEGAAEAPAPAELVLVPCARDLRRVAARIPVEPGLGEGDAALVLVQRVIEAQAEVQLVVQAAAARALPVGVVRKAVDVDVEIESLVRLAELGRRASRGSVAGALCRRDARRGQGQGRGEHLKHPAGFAEHPGVCALSRVATIGTLSVRQRTQDAQAVAV